jgi:hypothetical protein
MFNYRDFWPEQIEAEGFFTQARWQPFEEAMKAANSWVDEQGVKVINIETVVLPNIWDSDEEGTEDASLRSSGKSSTTWHQIIRVWYEE